ncbi:MAG: signal peptidase [Actinomycetota bacterium]|nr:signal peptidase [Actinomycetota bacterium]
MPPADEPGRRYRSPRHGEPDPRWGGPAAVAPVEDDPYGDVTGERPSVGRHGTPDDGARHGDGWSADDGWSGRPRHGGSEPPGRFDRDDDPLGGNSPGSWPPPSGRFGLDDGGRDRPSSRFGSEDPGPPPAPPAYGRPGPPPGGSSPYGQAPPSPPYGQSSPYRPSSSGPAWGPPLHYGQAPPSPPYGQAPPSPPYGQSSPYGAAPAGPHSQGTPNGYGPPNGHGPDPRHGGTPTGEDGPAAERGGPARPATGPGSTAVQPPVDARPGGPAPLLAGGTPPPKRDEADGSAPSSASPSSASRPSTSRSSTGPSADGAGHDHASEDADESGTTVLGDPARHRRGGASAGPGRDEHADDTSGPGRRSRTRAEERDPGGKKKRKGSFWRELPLLVVVAIVLTFVIQTFIARIYVIPSASMEQTLHGCDGCANDRVAVDKVTYRFGDPAPGDVVVFKGPPAWLDNDEVGETQPSSNPLVRGFQDALSLVGLAAPNEKDFVKRVIATGGQTVACCDAGNHVLVDGKPITEPYLYYQPGLGDKQATFDPVRVPDGQLWVMGDNRNNSADARFHGPVPVSDVIGKVRVVVLPISRWRTVPAIDPQTTTAALGATTPLGTGAAGAAGALLAVPVVGAGRRVRRAVAGDAASAAPPRPAPADGNDGQGGSRRVAEADRE